MSGEIEFIKLIADLLQQELDLERPVVLGNQAYEMPSVAGLNVAVMTLADKPFGVNSQHDSSGEGLTQIQTINVRETYQILLYSKNGEARQRRHEVMWALTGDAAQQLMEKYSFKIASIPSSFVDVSEEDGASRLNRYALTVNVLCAYSRTRRVDYFDKFQEPPFQLVTNQ